MEIRRYETDEEFRRAFSVMQELRTHLDEDAFMELVRSMVPEGYELYGLEVDGSIEALAGIAFRTNLYYGRYIWVFDLITRAASRSRGYGERLLGYVEDLGRERGCDVVALSSGVQRTDAHRFYEDRMSYDRVSYTFKKALTGRF
ncbi:MAG: GNAT family N-acetyltransferase [Actinomycetota bacterium]